MAIVQAKHIFQFAARAKIALEIQIFLWTLPSETVLIKSGLYTE